MPPVSNTARHLATFYLGYFGLLGILLPYLSLYLLDIGLNPYQIGVIGAMTPLVKTVAPSLWGWAADRRLLLCDESGGGRPIGDALAARRDAGEGLDGRYRIGSTIMGPQPLLRLADHRIAVLQVFTKGHVRRLTVGMPLQQKKLGGLQRGLLPLRAPDQVQDQVVPGGVTARGDQASVLSGLDQDLVRLQIDPRMT